MSDPSTWRRHGMERGVVPGNPPPPTEVEKWKQPKRRVIVFREVELRSPNCLYPWAEMEVGESFWAPPHVCSSQQFGGQMAHGEAVAKRVNGTASKFTLTGRGMNGRVLVTRVE